MQYSNHSQLQLASIIPDLPLQPAPVGVYSFPSRFYEDSGDCRAESVSEEGVDVTQDHTCCDDNENLQICFAETKLKIEEYCGR